MFHVEFLIDDRDVVKLRYALASFRIYNFEDKPVTNAKRVKGKVEEAVSGGTVLERVALALREHHPIGAQIDRKTIFLLVREVGHSPNTNLLNALIKAKVLKRKGRGVFVLLDW